MEMLIVGGMIQVPGVVNAPYSTVVYLDDGDHKILIDPGSFVVHQNLESSLESRSVKPDDITDILLTHFHLDHAYNSVFFENATVHLHPNYALKDYSKFGPIVGKEYLRVLNSWRRVSPIEDGDVLFGKIRVYHTPWHAREHVSFVVETENMGKVFVTGDICYTRLDYYEMVKGYRNDHVAKFIREIAQDVDLIVFTHDEPVKPLRR